MRNNLPLITKTPDRWAEEAMQDSLALLNDHAHLEKRAATNALELLTRWPQSKPSAKWVRTLSGIAKDEISHLATVSRLIESYGGEMSRTHKNQYAQGLRSFVRLGAGNEEVVDRLLVSALIELRSCERFEILSRLSRDLRLAKLYKSLWASEHGHFRVFLELANSVGPEKKVESRWRWMLNSESDLIKKQPNGPKMHGWL